MKTLDQLDAKLEKRTSISSLPFTVSAAGSYYLTQHAAVSGGNAITINADLVTLDLNGFTIESTADPAAGSGVLINGNRANIKIRNGFIRGAVRLTPGTGAYSGTGFANGISGVSARNVIVTDLGVGNCLTDGIDLGTNDSTVVERCVVQTVGENGIVAGIVTSCSAQECGGTSIVAETANDSMGHCTGSGHGLFAIIANNCRGRSQGGIGVSAQTASNCRGQSTDSFGLAANGMAMNCDGLSATGTGLSTALAENCTGQSTSGTGLSAGIATQCNGFSSSGAAGLNVTGTASYCRGQRNGGTAISANIAIGCTTLGGTITAPGGKFLGTP